MVRQRMIKPILVSNLGTVLVLISMLLLASCNPTQVASVGARNSSIANSDGTFDGYALVYTDSPAIIGGAKFPTSRPNMDSIINKRNPLFVTENSKLTGNCSMDFYFYGFSSDQIQDCIRSYASSEGTVTSRTAEKTFIFPTGSNEFYQTNALYHLQIAKDTFLKKLQFAYDNIHSLPLSVPKSIPSYLKDSKFFWFNGTGNSESQHFGNSHLTSYALCNMDNNAAYSPVGPSLCFGFSSKFAGFYFVQDPTIIYHEFGHALVDIMLNLRNGTGYGSHDFRSSFVTAGNEAAAINEGIADYFSFVMNKRTHIGEWALARGSKQSRPMTESDPSHISALSTTSEGRLSYPDYLLYDSNNPTKPRETVHYSGQIVSHYLVALTESFKTSCNLTEDKDGGHDRATSYVMMLLAESLSELGDLYAKGVDEFGMQFNYDYTFNNLDAKSSYLWAHTVNPTSYRKFFQTFAKNTYKYISSNLCYGFDKDASEKLLDDYGLLLFKTYNDNGNSSKERNIVYNDAVPDIAYQSLTPVTEDNRRKSTLVSKELLELAGSATGTGVEFYIVDSKVDIQNLLNDMIFKGISVPLSTKVAGTVYNNNNIKISPGEVVALIPNLYNASNTTMAGVQLLANDWDHVDITDTATGYFKPCVIDSKTTIDQGGEHSSTCETTDKDYKRLVQDKTTKQFPQEASAPVCLVQLNQGTSSKWVSQSEFRKKQIGLQLSDKDCLGYSASGTSDVDFSFNPHECLARFLPGKTTAMFSKIAPRKTYYQTVIEPSDNKKFNPGNLLMMEVNKYIPPGTKFRCRLRARFSNCEDCFTDGSNGNDDYLDYEYNGHKPYKVINFDFDVND